MLRMNCWLFAGGMMDLGEKNWTAFCCLKELSEMWPDSDGTCRGVPQALRFPQIISLPTGYHLYQVLGTRYRHGFLPFFIFHCSGNPGQFLGWLYAKWGGKTHLTTELSIIREWGHHAHQSLLISVHLTVIPVVTKPWPPLSLHSEVTLSS